MNLQRPMRATGKRSCLLVLGCALFLAAPLACGQVYKCKDPQGATTYADSPCPSGGRSLALPQSSKGSFTNATVCAQLQDEMRRLDDEANRDARRARPKSVAGAKRRQSLLAQYHRRCAAIARSEVQR